jgi:hypothetical protein
MFNGSVADGLKVTLGGTNPFNITNPSDGIFPDGGNKNCPLNTQAPPANNAVPPGPLNNCTIGSRGFGAWKPVHLRFTADNTVETLLFVGFGAPDGLPPISLITGVNMEEVIPEPSTWMLVGGGFILLGIVSMRHRRLALHNS